MSPNLKCDIRLQCKDTLCTDHYTYKNFNRNHKTVSKLTNQTNILYLVRMLDCDWSISLWLFTIKIFVHV